MGIDQHVHKTSVHVCKMERWEVTQKMRFKLKEIKEKELTLLLLSFFLTMECEMKVPCAAKLLGMDA